MRTYTSPVSNAADKRTDQPVSMDKKPSPSDARPIGRPAKATRVKQPSPSVPLPKTIQWATFAIIAQVVFTISHALAARGFTPQLTRLMIDGNKHAKNPEQNFDALKHLADYRKGLLFQGIVLGLAFIFLAYTLRRARGANGARWGFLIISVLVAQTNGPLTLLPISGYPGALQVIRALMGLSSLAALVLIFLPPSLQYFRACKAANRPEGAPVRPGLGAMFGARGAGRGSLFGPRPAAAPNASAATRAETSNPARPKSKAKIRVEADAVAKGAELARTRAKASKSRRTETS